MPTTDEWQPLLQDKLIAQREIVDKFEQWYDGDHPLPAATVSDNELYQAFQSMSKANGLQAVVDEPADRLAIEGIRMGRNSGADEGAWDLWQASHMDSLQPMLFTTAITTGLSYISVWPDRDKIPTFAPEHPGEVAHQLAGGSLRNVAAAIKIYPDEVAGDWICKVYEPHSITEWRSAGEWGQWTWRKQSEADRTFANPYGVVPFIPLLNRPTLKGKTSSEMQQCIPIQRRINQTILNMLVAGEAVAFPQKWATGLVVEKNPDGTPKRPFQSGADTVAVAENPNAKFGQFDESEFAGYLKMIAADFEHMCSISRTPLFAMSSNLSVPPSAEALVAMESGLVKKVEKKQRVFGEAFEDSMRLAFKMLNDPRQGEVNAEVIWKDPTIQSPATIADWAAKAGAVGVPQEAIWERMGATPAEITRWKAMQMSDAFRQLTLQIAEQRAAAAAGVGDQQQQQGDSGGQGQK